MYSIDNLPESGRRVIFGWMNDWTPPMRRTSIGFYAAPKTIDASHYEEVEAYEYSDADDCYYLQEGWYEEAAEGEYFYKVTAPTHWMPLPEWPKQENNHD